MTYKRKNNFGIDIGIDTGLIFILLQFASFVKNRIHSSEMLPGELCAPMMR
jgi:hypothetical protein